MANYNSHFSGQEIEEILEKANNLDEDTFIKKGYKFTVNDQEHKLTIAEVGIADTDFIGKAVIKETRGV